VGEQTIIAEVGLKPLSGSDPYEQATDQKMSLKHDPLTGCHDAGWAFGIRHT